MSDMINNELERLWKKVVVAQFDTLSRHLPRGTEGRQENQDIRFQVRGFNIMLLGTIPPWYLTQCQQQQQIGGGSNL
jgi:hypothetical protein